MVGLCKAVVVRVTEINPPGWIVCMAAVVMETNLLVGLCEGGSGEGDGD